jgi:exodeoxyribonuclease V beta subunit
MLWLCLHQLNATGFIKQKQKTSRHPFNYVNTPFKDQNSLPNYDSASYDFNIATIFTENAFTGYDRISDSHQVTTGATSRFLDPQSGAERARFVLAQRYRLRAQEVVLPGGVAATEQLSDTLAGTNLQLVNAWALDSALQYSPDAARMVRSTLGARYRPGPYRVLNMAYRYKADAVGAAGGEFVDTSWQWPLQNLLSANGSADNRLGSSLAQRLLASPDGERRINHLLHLGELLQHAGTRLSGCMALVRFLGEQIQSRSPPPDSAHMRLESDAQRVQIITYHKSKGLEYPWVWVPFLSSFGKPADSTQRPDMVLEAETTSGEDEVGSDEDMRLIYVALTRAREAAWVGMGPVTGELREASAKVGLLRSAPCELLLRTHKKDLMERLQSAWGHCPDIHITALDASTIEAQKNIYLSPSLQLDFSRLATPRPLNPNRWWTASFSAMTRQLDAELAIQASDEVHPDAPELSPQPAADTPLPVVADPLDKATSWIPVGERQATQLSRWQVFPAGARSGLLLHDLLQWQCEHGWPLAHDGPTETALAPGAWPGVVARKAMALDLTEVQTALINPWLQALLRTPLPTPIKNAPPLILGQLKPTQAWAEMPFTLAVSSAATQAIDALICAHVLPGLARRALWPQRLNGMLTGVMDLVFEHHGRYGVLDYKSNRLDHYQSPDLNAAVLDHRYDVQYVLYTLALHRLLQVRLPNYDYDQHMGGAVYVFLRGIDQTGAGVHLHRPARSLIEALDALLKKEVA